MGKDIQINDKTVEETHIRVASLVKQRLGTQGKEMSDKIVNQMVFSEGDTLLKFKLHMEAEQELVNHIGSLLQQITRQMKRAADGFKSKDKEYSKKKTT